LNFLVIVKKLGGKGKSFEVAKGWYFDGLPGGRITCRKKVWAASFTICYNRTYG
jgi:hypothetical protein